IGSLGKMFNEGVQNVIGQSAPHLWKHLNIEFSYPSPSSFSVCKCGWLCI
ncbi:hypothetical protein FRX31_027739, partial [Thalictrum thalictroides]